MRKPINTVNTRGIGNGSTTSRAVVKDYDGVIASGAAARKAAKDEFVPAHLRNRQAKLLGAYAK